MVFRWPSSRVLRRASQRPRKILLVGALFLAIALVLTPRLAPQILGIPTASSGDNRCWDYKSSEKGFNRKMNDERVARGQGRLIIDPELSKAARVHTDEMVSKDLLHHTETNALKNRVTGWSTLGENVGVGAAVSSLHDAFMNSPAHKANVLLGQFRHSGVGVVEKNGRMWVTILFEASNDPGTSLNMPRC